MPYAPFNTECKEYGCRNNKTGRSSFCLEHGGGITEKGKANAKLYNLEVWNNIRARQLSREPLCARCKQDGKITAAQQVDHVFPHNRDIDRFKTNIFQSLCQSCHTMKGQDERKGKYNWYSPHGVIVYYDSDYLRVVRKG